MVRIDENQEAIALIRMAIDNDNKARISQAQADEDHVAGLPSDLGPHTDTGLERHWTFGSHTGTRLDSRELEKVFAPTNCDFVSFDTRLRSFIIHYFPEEAPRYEDIIYVCSRF
jgi:hypothetical protein